MLSSINTLQNHSLVLFGLYNPIFFCILGLYNLNRLNFFWTVSGVYNAFLNSWTVEHILFDCSNDLGLVLDYR